MYTLRIAELWEMISLHVFSRTEVQLWSILDFWRGRRERLQRSDTTIYEQLKKRHLG